MIECSHRRRLFNLILQLASSTLVLHLEQSRLPLATSTPEAFGFGQLSLNGFAVYDFFVVQECKHESQDEETANRAKNG